MAQIAATGSSVINRARGLADIVGTQFATYNDLTNSLNESYRDLYERITDSSDDYFVTITTLSINVTQTTPVNPNEWLIPLPSDFYKLCYIDYQYNGSWQRMMRFSKAGRNSQGSDLRYRFNGQNLWLVGSAQMAASTVRLAYYPFPDQVYFPNQAFTFNTGFTDNQLTALQYPFYVPGQLPSTFNQDVNPAQPTYNGFLCILQGTGIYYVSNTLNSVTQLVATSAQLSYVSYYKGNVYWIQAGNLFGATFNPASPAGITGTQMTSSNTITWYDYANNFLFAVDGGTLKYATFTATPATVSLSTGGPITGSPPSGVLYYNNANGTPMWVTSGNVLTVNGISTGLTASYAVTDGTYIYRTNSRVLYRDTVNWTTGVVSKSETLATDVAYIGDPLLGWIPMIGFENIKTQAISVVPDYAFTYPNNLAYELMSYQVAMDVKRKQMAEADMAGMLQRKGELMDRFMDQLRRDDYQAERINNARTVNAPGGLFGVTY